MAGPRCGGQNLSYAYWFQKYTIDGWPEWETPAVDQTALIPWGLERHYRAHRRPRFRGRELADDRASRGRLRRRHAAPRPALDSRICSLISSAGLWDNRFGAFLYSNACVVAGLRSAARLAESLDKPEPASKLDGAGRPDLGCRHPGPFGNERARARDWSTRPRGGSSTARRLSTVRGLWTDRPDWLVERSAAVDVSLLGAAVPFGLLPASDPRLRNSAEAILRHCTLPNDPNTLSRWAFDPANPNPGNAPIQALRQEVSPLATLWMARYLIQLGRETGEGYHWNRALALLDGVLDRLGPLGLALRLERKSDDELSPRPNLMPGVWGLHAMLTETLLDLAGLDYDAARRRLYFEPALPQPWPHIGLSQPFRCGEVGYRLDRPVGGSWHRLILTARLRHPVSLQVDLTCPSLADLGPWQAHPAAPPPTFDRATGRLAWTVELPAGESTWEWSWGKDEDGQAARTEGHGVGTTAH